MFGSMRLGSKVTVTDFTADTCETAACLVPQQNNPHMEKDHYKQNGYHFGYKFYRTECEPRDSLTKDNRIYAVPAGPVFTGSIRFKGLRKKQLKLLLCSLGIGGHAFSHKLGGYRADGFGTVNLTCTAFTLNGETSTPAKATVGG